MIESQLHVHYYDNHASYGMGSKGTLMFTNSVRSGEDWKVGTSQALSKYFVVLDVISTCIYTSRFRSPYIFQHDTSQIKPPLTLLFDTNKLRLFYTNMVETL
ncbi:hypothetical protein ACF0H5_005446 [Mactra antiquata]